MRIAFEHRKPYLVCSKIPSERSWTITSRGRIAYSSETLSLDAARARARGFQFSDTWNRFVEAFLPMLPTRRREWSCAHRLPRWRVTHPCVPVGSSLPCISRGSDTPLRRRRNAAVILPYCTGRKIPVTGPERGSRPGGRHREFVRRGRCIAFALACDSWRCIWNSSASGRPTTCRKEQARGKGEGGGEVDR